MARKRIQERNRRLLVLGIISLVAVAVIAVLIIVSRPSPQAVGVSHIDPSIPKGLTEDGLPYVGDPDAPVTMLIYEDLGCPNCRNFFHDVEPSILDEFVANDQVRIVIYTLAFVNPRLSLPGAEAVTCALDQNKFWEYRTVLYDNQGVSPFSRQNLVDWAEELGLDRGEFGNCFDQALHQKAIIEQSQRAFEFGITATPTSEINGVRHQGVIPFNSQNPLGIKQLIDAELLEVGG